MSSDVTHDRTFPEGFVWGTATAAHQIEGGNWNNDWWAWEHARGTTCAEPSGDACDSWSRWEEDVSLVADLGLGSYRFSLEWSRIEPEEGEWSHAAVEHYRRQCLALRARGVEPTVTFHHFTTPRWVTDRGGWEDPATADRFAAFCARLAGELGDVIGRACTINEPNVVATVGWLLGFFPPGKTDRDLRLRVNDVFVDAHRKAVDAIRDAAPGVPVGLTLSMTEYVAVDGGEERMARMRQAMEDVFLDATDGDDFLGVQTYSRLRIGPRGVLGPEEGVPVLDMGYELWPQSLEACLRRAWDRTGGRVPLLVTENGIGTTDDAQRLAYVHAALEGVLRALADGIDVRGYTYWSLLDNFEWAYGYRPRFGLVAVDRTSFARTPKPSADWYRRVALANALVAPAG
ncbi:MAG TPA: glycoside hydrolase family 1 protein [Acidimicrobiales bacterium]|nr:glycoside hydrolase family 1 protein [Acidimicrobiales bacterium]